MLLATPSLGLLAALRLAFVGFDVLAGKRPRAACQPAHQTACEAPQAARSPNRGSEQLRSPEWFELLFEPFGRTHDLNRYRDHSCVVSVRQNPVGQCASMHG